MPEAKKNSFRRACTHLQRHRRDWRSPYYFNSISGKMRQRASGIPARPMEPVSGANIIVPSQSFSFKI